ncbi:MAG: L-iditol 2-dehydrogenase [uncultured bacterium]|nr:MAG: L-iditol 2-dehydrogenase [uncultured bacterium]
MRAAVYNQGKLEIVNIDRPILSNNGAIIKIHGCGLCGSDIVKYKEALVLTGTVLGHEIIGEIVELRTENENFKVGDKVVAGHHVPCFQCSYCKNESYSMCKDFKESNIIPGGFTEYIYVSAAHLDSTVFKIENDLSDVEASFTEPVACCLRAIKRANICVGDNVFIIGLGSIGLIMGQLAKHYGARVAGCDLLDERIDFATELGFDEVYKFTTLEQIKNSYMQYTNHIGADKVFLASGSLSSIPFSVSLVRDGGTIVVFSSVPSDEGVFVNNDIYYRELTIMGSYSPSPQDLCDSLNLLKNNIIKVGNFTTAYDLNNIDKAISDTLANKIIKAYIKI